MVNPQRLRDALQFIDPSDRDTWVRMGMAIKSELGDAGFSDWDTWSRQAANYDPKAAQEVWKSIRATGDVGIGSLFHAAQVHGWSEIPAHSTESNDAGYKETDPTEFDPERAETAAKAACIWRAATPVGADHPYLLRKQVTAVSSLREIEARQAAALLGYPPRSHGQPLTGRLLVVPVKQAGRLSTLELIDGEGHKTALAGRGTKSGGYWATDPVDASETLLLGEGVATVLTARDASGLPAIATLSSGNLSIVAQALRQRYPTTQFIILADLDKTTGTPDRQAIKAAQRIGANLAVPTFDGPRDSGMTDFNDLAHSAGLDAVRQAIVDATLITAESTRQNPDNWPLPQELTATSAALPYPLDALPLTVRAAVEEVASFVKAPISLVASSALAYLSLAVQASVDVMRAEKLQGPTGLFFLTIADSGERKSTCDQFFGASLRDYEAQQRELAAPLIKDYQADIEAWDCKRNAIREKIRHLTKNDKATDRMEAALRDLEHQKPESPPVPRLLYADSTPEALAYSLATQWPSGGVMSSEAGIVFGSHAMARDAVMRNMALLNIIWDGGELTIDRRTSESFVVKGARLTAGLQIQEATLREFFTRTGPLARGTGFMARFLLSHPQSTQGQRLFSHPPESWPHLADFHRRLTALLEQPIPIGPDAVLTPRLMTLTPEAKAAWIAFHDMVETQLGSGGLLFDVRDVASKAADNVARLAALFQVVELGESPISLPSLDAASRLVGWHLTESLRFFGELCLPEELSAAVRLDDWLLTHCQREGKPSLSKNYIRQHGPLRNREKLDAALQELRGLDRLRLSKDGRRTVIAINPTLLGAS